MDMVQRLSLIIVFLFLPWSMLWAGGCDLQRPADKSQLRQAIVQNVIDGDTVRLTTGRLVRFIGINTPEIDHKTGQAEPFANEARDYLRAALGVKPRTVLLQTGRDKQDRHGRMLAHIFTPSGKNLQAQMIRKGLGVWIVMPPNLHYMDCYRAQEQVARRQHRGVWGAQFKQPRDAQSLGKQDRGFQWIRGRITRIGEGRTSLWLNFGDTATLRVYKDDLHYFKGQPLRNLKGKVVTARGWMYPYKHQLVMTVHHPATMKVQP